MPAAQKLVRLYGGNLVKAETDLTKAGELLAGHIPTIAEVVKRAKLAQIVCNPLGTSGEHLSEEALIEASRNDEGSNRPAVRTCYAKVEAPTLDKISARCGYPAAAHQGSLQHRLSRPNEVKGGNPSF